MYSTPNPGYTPGVLKELVRLDGNGVLEVAGHRLQVESLRLAGVRLDRGPRPEASDLERGQGVRVVRAEPVLRHPFASFAEQHVPSLARTARRRTSNLRQSRGRSAARAVQRILTAAR